MDLSKLIVKSSIYNTNASGYADQLFQTNDYVYLPTSWALEGGGSIKSRKSATDYALANTCLTGNFCTSGGKSAIIYACRNSVFNRKIINAMHSAGNIGSIDLDDYDFGIAPRIALDVNEFIKERQKDAKFCPIYSEERDNSEFHFLDLGEFPKTAVRDYQNEKLLKWKKFAYIGETGKTYSGLYNATLGGCEQYKEYEVVVVGGTNEKYVLAEVNDSNYSVDNYFENGVQVSTEGEWRFFKVEPIKWKILNWKDLPTEINPEGNETAKVIELETDECILSGIPFFAGSNDITDNQLWQNSTIRGYLNGINVNNISSNGNLEHKCVGGGNFKGKGFLQEAFGIDRLKQTKVITNNQSSADSDNQNTQSIVNNNYQDNQSFDENGVLDNTREGSENIEIEEVIEPITKRTRLEKLNPDTTSENERRKMTDTEKIHNWIESGESVLLRGPSGIGKTERIKTLYPDLIYIKLTNNMFPEKVVGSVNLQNGQNIPPDFAKQALMNCATEEEKQLIQDNIQNLYDLADQIYERSKDMNTKNVILLDELLNVKPAVQSLVYTLVLNKLVESGKGLKLPANTVVVATGNQKKYSSVAEDLAEPLEKRFDHILDMEPKVSEWIYEYAIPNNIHPSVVGYMLSKFEEHSRSNDIEDISYFYEEPEVAEKHLDKNGCKARTNDPRGWTSISNTLYNFEEGLKSGKFVGKNVEDLLSTSISSKLREEWASDFFDYYNNPTISVEDVVEKKYSTFDLPDSINERYSYMTGLITANENQVKECRNFIRENCGPEYLSVYDIYWAGEDEDKLIKISELQEEDVDILADRLHQESLEDVDTTIENQAETERLLDNNIDTQDTPEFWVEDDGTIFSEI